MNILNYGDLKKTKATCLPKYKELICKLFKIKPEQRFYFTLYMNIDGDLQLHNILSVGGVMWRVIDKSGLDYTVTTIDCHTYVNIPRKCHLIYKAYAEDSHQLIN